LFRLVLQHCGVAPEALAGAAAAWPALQAAVNRAVKKGMVEVRSASSLSLSLSLHDAQFCMQC